MAKHEQTEPIVVWEGPDQTQTNREGNIVSFPDRGEADHWVRVVEPVPGKRPLTITQVSSGFGRPSQPKSLLASHQTAA